MQVEDWFDMKTCYEACLANLETDMIELQHVTQDHLDESLKQHVLDIMLPEYLYSLIPVTNDQRIVDVIQSVTRIRRHVFNAFFDLIQSSFSQPAENTFIGKMKQVNDVLSSDSYAPLQSRRLQSLLDSTCQLALRESERHLLIPWCLRVRNDLVDALLCEKQQSVGNDIFKPLPLAQSRHDVSLEELIDMTCAVDLIFTDMLARGS